MSILDADRCHVAIAQKEGTASTAPLLVDPILGTLLCAEEVVSEAPRTINTHRIDANRAYSALAWNGTDLQPLLIDNTNGYVLCDAT